MLTIVREFLTTARNAGYEPTIHYKKHRSVYIALSKFNCSEMSFILRFSDHMLNSNNQYPAGVINCWSDLSTAIQDLKDYIKLYEQLSPSQEELLWTVRPC